LEYVVNKYFGDMGAKPEVVSANDKKVVVRLHNSIFHELTQKNGLICDVLHRSFHEGLEAMAVRASVSRTSV